MLLRPTWLHIPRWLALGEWSHHCDYLSREDLFCTVLLCILATSLNIFCFCTLSLILFGLFLSLKTEKAMATHSSTLAWKIPWTEEPGRLQSMGSLRVGHNWATSLSVFTFRHWRRKWQPTPVFLPGGLLSVGLHRVGRLKQLSSSSSISDL